jgi:hypothetical protein
MTVSRASGGTWHRDLADGRRRSQLVTSLLRSFYAGTKRRRRSFAGIKPLEGALMMTGLSGLDALKRVIEEESNDGRALAENLADNPICAVSFDDAVPCVRLQWRGYATSAQLRFIHECLIGLIKQHHVSKILGDDTALVSVTSEDQDWIIWEWIPRAIAAGLRVIASKRPHGYYGRVSVDRILAVISPKLRVRSFDDLTDARQWLCHPL